MQLLNNGKRKIIFKDLVIEAGELFEISKANGEQLIRLFGDEIVVPTAKKASDDDDKKVQALQAELEAVKANLQVAQADLEAVKAERDELKQQVEEVEAELTKIKTNK